MKRETLFLKIVVFLIGIPVLGLSIFWLPGLANIAAKINPMLTYLLLIGLYATVILFFSALYQTLKLLSYIDMDNAFSELSVRALRNIKYCAITIGILYGVCMPLLYLIAEIDDAPGIIVIGLIIIFTSTVIASFAAVLQKLLKKVIDIKSGQ